MSFLIDVAVPKLPLGVMAYEAPVLPAAGARVIVEVKKTLHVGFVLGESEQKLSGRIKIKQIEGIIDSECMLDSDLWDLILWVSRVNMCGVNAALRAILPLKFSEGEEIKPPLHLYEGNKNFREVNYFNPLYSERVKFYMDEIDKNERTLILFPTKAAAKKFNDQVSKRMTVRTILWHENRSWLEWNLMHEKICRVVIGSPGAVFAPLRPEKIIIEDEANPLHMIPYKLNISARSLAGVRAQILKAEFITAGTMPSLKTYMRKKPEQKIIPERKNIILADIFHYRTRKEKSEGIDGNIPITFSLIKRTYKELMRKNNVLWILNRTGESSEVYCENCGNSLKCEKCGGTMKSIHDGNVLRCHMCGHVMELPEKCKNCGFKFFRGKRPGLEALLKIVRRYYDDVHIYVEGSKKSEMHGLILSTNKGLELCAKIKPGLIAWLDLDSDLGIPSYNTRFNVFRELYESYWRGREKNPDRKILIQSRKSGMKLANFLSYGWKSFLDDELKTRYEYLLPPYGYIIELECESKIIREEMIKIFDSSGIFVMDPGDDEMPLYINTNSLEAVRKVIEPLKNSLKQSIKITVRSE